MLRRYAFLALALALALPGCDEFTGTTDDAGNDEAFLGEWIGTEMLFTNTADASQEVDAIPLTGTFMTVTFDADSTASLTQWDPGSESWYNDTGTWTAGNGQLAMDWQDSQGPDTVAYAFIDDDHVTVEIDDEEWDFDGDGTSETATLTFTFTAADLSPDPDLVGTWDATAFVFTSVADPSTSVDLVQHGATFTVSLAADGTYDLESSFPDGQGGTETEQESGDYTGLEGLLWVTAQSEAGPNLLLYNVSGSTAIVANEHESFDFDGDGTEEAAVLEIALSKQ